jgi:hypothetical protein
LRRGEREMWLDAGKERRIWLKVDWKVVLC